MLTRRLPRRSPRMALTGIVIGEADGSISAETVTGIARAASPHRLFGDKPGLNLQRRLAVSEMQAIIDIASDVIFRSTEFFHLRHMNQMVQHHGAIFGVQPSNINAITERHCGAVRSHEFKSGGEFLHQSHTMNTDFLHLQYPDSAEILHAGQNRVTGLQSGQRDAITKYGGFFIDEPPLNMRHHNREQRF